MGTRRAAVAGAFYPGEESELREAVDGLLASAKETGLDGTLRGLVVPHAGYIYSGPVAACGYKMLACSARKPKRAVILGPSHYALFLGACESGHEYWETPLGAVRALSEPGGLVSVLPQPHAPEHCIEVQLPFLQRVLDDFSAWPLLCGEVDAQELAGRISGAIDDDTIVIASSDLSHYLPYGAAVARDRCANESVPGLDLKRFSEDGDACGKGAILTLMHLAKMKGWKGLFVDYRNSGDTAGPKSEVVGYGCYAFYSER